MIDPNHSRDETVLPSPAMEQAVDVVNATVLFESPLCGEFDGCALIYALVDPREPEIVRYVGQSTNPGARYISHTTGLGVWPRHLRKRGSWPRMVLLERIQEGDIQFPGLATSYIRCREVLWMDHFMRLGQCDLNRRGGDHDSSLKRAKDWAAK